MDGARRVRESGQAFLPHRPPGIRHKSDGCGQRHETIRQSRTGRLESRLDRVATSTDESPFADLLDGRQLRQKTENVEGLDPLRTHLQSMDK